MRKSPFDHTSARGHDEEMEEWREDMVEEEEEDKEEGENEMVGDENRERGESTRPRTEKRGNQPRGRRMDRENKNKVGVRRGKEGHRFEKKDSTARISLFLLSFSCAITLNNTTNSPPLKALWI